VGETSLRGHRRKGPGWLAEEVVGGGDVGVS
jgi:hypothetical protein